MADLDTGRLSGWLRDNLPEYAGPFEFSKFDSGQSNPTYLLDFGPRKIVLRRRPSGQLLKSAHAVDREYRVQSALAETPVPTAPMLAHCTETDVIGAEFYLMGHVAGQIHFDPTLPDLGPGERARVYDQLNHVLAALHSVDIDAVGLSDFGPPGNYVARQIERWTRQYTASETGPLADMDRLIAILGERRDFADDQRRLVHGDYRLDNMIFSDDMTCLALLDWELSTIGHPIADLASLIMQWRLPPGRIGRGLAGVDRRDLGIPSDDAFVTAYCDRLGLDGIPEFDLYLAFAFFRMAAILQGVKKRGLDGNASNPDQARQYGEFVPEFARLGLACIE